MEKLHLNEVGNYLTILTASSYFFIGFLKNNDTNILKLRNKTKMHFFV